MPLEWQLVNHRCSFKLWAVLFNPIQVGNMMRKGIRYSNICQCCNRRTNGILAQSGVVDSSTSGEVQVDSVDSHFCLRPQCGGHVDLAA